MVAMATSLEKLENKVEIHHRHVKRYHMLKRYEHRSSISGDIQRNMFSAETTGPIFTKNLHDIVALVALFNYAYTRRYPIPFLNARAAKLLIFRTNLFAIATTLEILEKEIRLDHLHPKRLHSVKRLRKSVQWIMR